MHDRLLGLLRFKQHLLTAGLTVLVALVASGCGSSTHIATVAAIRTVAVRHGGVVTFAEPPGTPLNYIFPFTSSQYSDNTNSEQFQWLMYRPLYWYGQGGNIVLNEQLSLATTPRFSDNNAVVTVTMKPTYKWSDGEPVDAADVEFWMNMLEAEKTNWAAYVPGGFPDDLASYKVTSKYTIVFKFKHPFAPGWITYNPLDQITPLPLAWDVTDASGTPGHCATTVSACAPVYRYLAKLGAQMSQFATAKVWQVVNGPWRLSAFSSDGQATFIPNRQYTGGPQPHFSKFVELPFTSDTSEYSVLQSGNGAVDVGYIPLQDAPAKGSGSNPLSDYTLSPWNWFAINFVEANYNNPTMGPVFRQLYFRQAVQQLIDQPGYIQAATKGWGYPTYGPVPTQPPSDFVAPSEKTNPYPYNPSSAVATLRAHGWSVVANGVSTCVRPGTGSSDCGVGIPQGRKLAFSLVYPSGEEYLQSMFAFMRSALAGAGIAVTESTEPLGSLFGDTVPCKPTASQCAWQAHDVGGWAYTPPLVYPTGEVYMQTGAAYNLNSLSNPTIDSAVIAAYSDAGLGALYHEENVVGKQLPEMYLPESPYQLTEVSNSVGGVLPLAPSLAITPEFWYPK